jgi:hypothetical protein
VSNRAVSVPIGDSPCTAPGWLFLDERFSCIPDSHYPWDPAVLRIIRQEICDDAMPITIRSTWMWSNYNELGYMPIMTLVRHGLARSVRQDGPAVHRFNCEMPSYKIPGLCIPGRALSDCYPNQIWDNWYSKTDRPYGYDLPGAYLPFDWDYLQALRRAEGHRLRMLRESRREVDEAGEMVAKGAAKKDVKSLEADRKNEKAAKLDQDAYIARDLVAYHSAEPSDLEWKEAMLGGKGITGEGAGA